MNSSRYVTVFMGVAITSALIVEILNLTIQSDFGSSAAIMVPAMIAAVIEGNQFARHKKRKMKPKEIWGFTIIATLIAVLLNLMLAYLGGWAAPAFSQIAIIKPLSQQFNLLLLMYAVGYLLCNRLFLSIGASNRISTMRSRGELD